MLIMTITTLGIRVLRYKMMVVVLERAGRAYTCTRTYTHAHAYTQAFARTHMHTWQLSYEQVGLTRLHIHIHMRTHMHARTYMYTCTCTHTYNYTCTHTHIFSIFIFASLFSTLCGVCLVYVFGDIKSIGVWWASIQRLEPCMWESGSTGTSGKVEL